MYNVLNTAMAEITGAEMSDKTVYESLPLVYKVFAKGVPKPLANWTVNGEPIKPSQRVEILEEGDCYKLHILDTVMADAGHYQCEISNKLGTFAKKATLSVICKSYIIS